MVAAVTTVTLSTSEYRHLDGVAPCAVFLRASPHSEHRCTLPYHTAGDTLGACLRWMLAPPGQLRNHTYAVDFLVLHGGRVLAMRLDPNQHSELYAAVGAWLRVAMI